MLVDGVIQDFQNTVMQAALVGVNRYTFRAVFGPLLTPLVYRFGARVVIRDF